MDSRAESVPAGLSSPSPVTVGEEVTQQARTLSKHVIRGFQAHDAGDYERAVEAFAIVDRRQFRQLDDEDAEMAARAYVDALFEKDEVEFDHLADGGIDAAALDAADWSPVRRHFRIRAGIVGMDAEYAIATTEAWKRHKAGGDYWTPIMRAQMHELRAALRDPTYPHKPKHGQSGYGPEPVRYALAIELHDMHEAEYANQAIDVMTPYFERILATHTHDDT